jgi:hypothetical protein
MSTDRDLARVLGSWLHEDTHEDADRVLDLVLAQVDTTPQRQARWLVRRFPALNNNIFRFGIAAAALVLAAIIGIKLLAGPNVGGPSQTPTPTPSPTPQTIPLLSPYTQPGTPLTPGNYRIVGQASEEMVATLPDGWFANSYSRGGGVYRGPSYGLTSQDAWLSISSVGTLLADGCSSALLEPRIGPTIDELVAALSALPIVQISAPVSITLDGYQGKQIDLTYRGGLVDSSCDVDFFYLWRTPPIAGESWNVVIANGWRSTLRILDVDGLRWIIITSYRLDAPSSQMDAASEVQRELGQIVDSIKLR